MRLLVVGLGNDLLGDDGIGVSAARELSRKVSGLADVIDCNLTGIALLDILVGYDKVIIIDAIRTAKFPPGTIIEMTPEDLRAIPGTSPHYTGLPEVIAIADRLRLDFPDEIKILAVEVAEPLTIGGKLSEPVANALNRLVQYVRVYLQCWEKEALKVIDR